MVGKHSRNALCNNCGKAESDRDSDDNPVSLLQDLEEYADEDRIWQGERTPDNPLPQFLVWCLDCAKLMLQAGEPITQFREFGYEDKPDQGPYHRYLREHGRWITSRRPPFLDR